MITSWEDPNNELLYAELWLERYGPPPVAEYRRPILTAAGMGGPDTEQNIRRRRRIAAEALRGAA